VDRLARLDLVERGPIRRHRCAAWVSRLPSSVGERELAAVRQELGWPAEHCRVETVANRRVRATRWCSSSSGARDGVFTGFGERGRAAEEVARQAAAAARSWLQAEVPVSDYLADQLLLPMALAGGDSFRTVALSLHAKTNAAIIRRFLEVPIRFEQEDDVRWRVMVVGDKCS